VIEGDICLSYQFGTIVEAGLGPMHAEATGNMKYIAVDERNWLALDNFAELFGARESGISIAVWKNDEKLLSPIAADLI